MFFVGAVAMCCLSVVTAGSVQYRVRRQDTDNSVNTRYLSIRAISLKELSLRYKLKFFNHVTFEGKDSIPLLQFVASI